MNIKINKKSAVPIVQQIRDKILAHIKDIGLTANDKLPSERDIARNNNLNVNTVAKAYRMLVDEGYLIREVGRGTFVNTTLTKGKILFLVYTLHYQPGAIFGRFIIDAVEDIFRAHGYGTEIIEIPYQDDERIDEHHTLINGITGKVYSGIFIGGMSLSENTSALLRENRIPVVGLDSGRTVHIPGDHYYIDFHDFFKKSAAFTASHGYGKPLYIGATEILDNGVYTSPLTCLHNLFAEKNIAFDDTMALRLSFKDITDPEVYARICSFIANRDFDVIISDNDIFSEMIQLSLLANRVDMSQRILVTHANRDLDRLIVIPAKKIYFDSRDYAARIARRMVSLVEQYEEPQPKAIPVPFLPQE
ncbi:MAG: GntR family transcriptional regulator [Spirochaetes bacterium]|nr:GntR family transcriptional regulator [Spirochaetota bacterium]